MNHATRPVRLRRAVVLLLFVALCAVVFVGLLRIAGGLPSGDVHRFQVVVPSAGQLVSNADVRIHGVLAGRIAAVSGRGSRAVLAVELDDDHGPLPADSRVRVRTKTLVGESYLEVLPGRAGGPTVPDGGVLRDHRAEQSTQLDDVLSSLAPVRRERVRRTLAGVGRGLEDPEESLNRTLRALAGAVEVAGPTAEVLAGTGAATAGLVDDLGRVLDALADRERAIGTLARRGAATADAVARETDGLRTGLVELPATLTEARRTTRSLADVGVRVGPVLDDLSTALDRLGPTLRRLPATSAATTSALRRLRAVRPDASALLERVAAVTPTATATIGPLRDLVAETAPLVRALAPYAEDTGHLAALLRSVGSSEDATGALARIVAIGSAGVLTTMPRGLRDLAGGLQALGIADTLDTRGVNAYPRPGTALSPGPEHAFRRIERDPR
ncbi:MAG: MlaD family protein [Solirubrobacteraceae bacterium]|nr:MlaD family protein [Solirubrobacteraceae bacterium]